MNEIVVLVPLAALVFGVALYLALRQRGKSTAWTIPRKAW